MITVNLQNKKSQVTINANKLVSDVMNATITLFFTNDEDARNSELVLKKNNFSTKHNDCVIDVLNAQDFCLSVTQ